MATGGFRDGSAVTPPSPARTPSPAQRDGEHGVGRFAVVTDSTADVPSDWIERYGITVVPLSVRFGNESFRDRIDLTEDEFFDRLRRADRLPTTAAPPPGAFAEVYERLSQTHDGVISIHIGSNISGTVEAARLGSEVVRGFPVRVVDSRSLTMCVAFLCRIAAEAPTLGEAVRRVEERIPRLRILALLDTLRFVEMGGRVSRAQAMIGSMLDLKPILRMSEGAIRGADRVRTRARAIPRLVEMLRQELPVEHLAVMHAQASVEGVKLRQQLAAELPHLEVPLGQTGAVLAAHTGPGSIGLCYVKAP
jgi:DegV family protein with EDD domain